MLWRVAILGFGAMGRHHARVLAGAPEHFTVAGAFDPSAPVAPAVRAYPSAADAIADADVVVVASPIAAHAEGVLRAASMGRHVLVEKPIGASLVEARAMCAAAERAAALLFVGHSERFNPVVRAIAREVAPESIRAIATRRVAATRGRGVANDALLNLGVHDVDLAAHLTRSRVRVVAASGGDGDADLLCETSSGCSARVHVARALEARERSIVVETRDAVWRGDLLRFRLARFVRATGELTEIPVDGGEPLALQARALAAALAGGAPGALATGRDGAAAVRAVDEARALLARRGSAIPADNL